MKSPTHIAALEYAARGWYVLPCVPGGKLPATQHGYHEASRDPAQIDAWWNFNPNYNVAVAVGPSGLVDLDVDVGVKKDGTPKRGRESLAEIESELTATLLAETPSGGIHAIYARPDGVEPKRIIGFRDGLDLIGDGYFVAAPSFSSEKGRYYQWTQLAPIAPLPPFLANVTRQRPQEKVSELGTPIVEGGRNNALFKLGCALRDTGISREALARALDFENHARFSPPLPDPEVVTIIDSIMSRVVVSRDVAAGAVVEQEIQTMFAPRQPEEWIDQVAATPMPPVLFYSTGFPELDKLLNGGFATGQLAGIIAPPSTGKSALVGHWILELEKHRPVLHCSLELLKPELFVRYASHEMMFPWVEGVRGHVDQQAMANAVRGKRIKLMGADDFDRLDPFGSLEAAIARMTKECGIAPIVVIDYIQIMARAAATEMRHKVGELTQRARRLAQNFGTVVLGVFTTQRDKYALKQIDAMRAAQDPRAYLGAAKESGDIEFDCAVLMYLDVDMLTKGSPKPAQLAVSRCRYGKEGFVGLRATLEFGRFAEDMSAVGEFASEARKQKKEDDEAQVCRNAVLEAIRALAGRRWGEIQGHACKIAKTRGGPIDKARDALKAEGVIVEDEVRENGRKVPRAITFRMNETSPVEEHHDEDSE